MEPLESAYPRWRARAERLREIAAVCRAGEGIEWASTAADAFRVRLAEAAARIEGLADAAMRVAEAYRWHEEAVAGVLENIEAYAKDAKEADEGIREAARELADGIRRGSREAWELIRENPELLERGLKASAGR